MTMILQGIADFGLAFEAVYGTYVAPTKFFPVRNVDINKVRDTQYRMNIRGLADRQSPMPSYTRTEGEISIEATADALIYFLYAARTTPAKSGSGTFTYTFAPANVAVPTTAASGATNRRTLSIYTKKSSGSVFGYTGVSVGRIAFSVEESILVATMGIMGIDEASQSSTTATYAAGQSPYGAGECTIVLGTKGSPGSARADIDTVNIEINDNIQNEQRIKTGTGPAFNRWGEREVSGSFDVDFDTRTDYDNFVNIDYRYETTLSGVNSASDSVAVKINQLTLDSFPVPLSTLGDLVRASADFHGYYEAADAYVITCVTTESIT